MKRLLKGKITDLGVPQTPSAPGSLLGGDPSIAFKTQASGKRGVQQLMYDLISLFRWVKSNTVREKLSLPVRSESFQKKSEFRTLEWLKSGQSGERSAVPTASLKL